MPESRVNNVDSIFFAVRVIRVWNSLPDDVVAADRLSMFICRLKHTNLSQFILVLSLTVLLTLAWKVYLVLY